MQMSTFMGMGMEEEKFQREHLFHFLVPALAPTTS
jgi:hypothetical protein